MANPGPMFALDQNQLNSLRANLKSRNGNVQIPKTDITLQPEIVQQTQPAQQTVKTTNSHRPLPPAPKQPIIQLALNPIIEPKTTEQGRRAPKLSLNRTNTNARATSAQTTFLPSGNDFALGKNALRKTVTNDRSAPVLSGSVVEVNNSALTSTPMLTSDKAQSRPKSDILPKTGGFNMDELKNALKKRNNSL